MVARPPVRLAIDAMRLEDLPAVHDIERVSFTTPWPATAYRTELESNRLARYLVIRAGGRVVGYAGLWIVVDEAHVTTFAVAPAWRRRRIGERLLVAVLDLAVAAGAREATLEVRLSNLAARRLYEKHGFRPVGIRPRYYSDDNEDALIMTTEPLAAPQMAARLAARRAELVAAGADLIDPPDEGADDAPGVNARPIRLLAIESSCDETAVAIVEDGRRIVAHAIASQVALHAPAGGIVPELAARAHLRWIVPALDEVLRDAGVGLADLDGVAVTAGPGLAGSLLVGVSFAKAVAWVHGLPLVAVNHLEGHLYASWLVDPGEAARPEPPFPLVALVVSGGHTFLVEMRDHLDYRLLGETVDDAAGEAFDKAGRLLGLGYPGGPAIARAALDADGPGAQLPRAWLGDTFDFSFSGLKTALRRAVEAELATAGRPSAEAGGTLDGPRVAALARGFQAAVVEVLAVKAVRAAAAVGARAIVLGGGVAANDALRSEVVAGAARLGLPVMIPRAGLCTDNGAMIGAAGYRRFVAGERAGLDLAARPAWPLARPAGAPTTRRPPRRGAAGRAYRAALAAQVAGEDPRP